MSFLDPLLGVVACGAEVTQLGAIGYGAEVRAALAQTKNMDNKKKQISDKDKKY
jgi:hypothetical protein